MAHKPCFSRAQSVTEYALIISLIAIVAVVALSQLGQTSLGALAKASLSAPFGTTTSLGKTPAEITGNMIELVLAYHQEHGRWPRSWGDYAFTDLGLDPSEWKASYQGIVYKPAGNRLMITPEKGYYLEVRGMDGQTHILTSSYNWNLVYRMETGTWHYHSVGGPVIDIQTLKVIPPSS